MGNLRNPPHSKHKDYNDLDLPHGIPTFGFQTAKHIGVEVVMNLMVDAKTTSRWYFVISMGRKAGHLALGIGKATGATLTLIPEEFPEGEIRLKQIIDILVGAIRPDTSVHNFQISFRL